MTTSSVTTLPELLPTLVEDLPQVLEEVVGLLREEWPDYASFLADDPAGVAETAEAALHRLVALAQGDAAAAPPTAGQGELFEELGRIEWREGRSLSSLLSAYRAGARVAWRHMSRGALRRGVAPEAIAQLAEAVFVFVEDLSSASARGYVDEQLATAAERERVRAELADLLMSERADLTLVRTAAAAAGWPLPATAALVVVDPAHGHDFFARLDTRSLPIRRPELAGAIVPDPDAPGRRTRLADALRGLGAVVSSAVPLELLPATTRDTTTALRLHAEGLLVDDPIFVDDHYDALLVHGDARLLALLTEQALAPLAGLPPPTRERWETTLAAWLRSMGDRQEMARVLHVHPQTVRYRVGQLRSLFGTALDDPAARLRLTLALCWRGL
ncbi:MAG TPA: helix-turn-helix domain-containing protein [Mycobacteriales bacterium]|nr:helix-turn-helix domain-containing protein [Mycobacteriales bacterium]